MPQLAPAANIELRDVKSTIQDLVKQGKVETFLGVSNSPKGTLVMFFDARHNRDVIILVRDSDVSAVLTQVFEAL